MSADNCLLTGLADVWLKGSGLRRGSEEARPAADGLAAHAEPVDGTLHGRDLRLELGGDLAEIGAEAPDLDVAQVDRGLAQELYRLPELLQQLVGHLGGLPGRPLAAAPVVGSAPGRLVAPSPNDRLAPGRVSVIGTNVRLDCGRFLAKPPTLRLADGRRSDSAGNLRSAPGRLIAASPNLRAGRGRRSAPAPNVRGSAGPCEFKPYAKLPPRIQSADKSRVRES